MDFTQQNILLADLKLNEVNDRHGKIISEPLVIDWLLHEDGGTKILHLAEHIALKGLGIDPVIVLKEKNKESYVVWEGNRRITSMKILNNPGMCESDSIREKFRKWAKENPKNVINKINCHVASSMEPINDYIERKHTGEMGGIGTAQWNPFAQGNFLKRTGKTPRENFAMQAIEFVKEEGDLDSEKIKKVPATNLERLLGDPDFRKSIGLGLEDGQLTYAIKKSEVLKGLEKTILDVADKKIKVDDIKTKELRRDYFEKWKRADKPDLNKKTKTTFLDPAHKDSDQKRPRSNKSKMATQDRPRLIPRDCKIDIEDQRIANIFDELKKRLKVEEHTNAVAVLFRVFVELSVDSYLERNKLFKNDNEKRNAKLRNKINQTRDHLVKNGRLKQKQKKSLQKLNHQNSIFYVDTFNDYIHNQYTHPVAGNLKSIWDNLQALLEKIWEEKEEP